MEIKATKKIASAGANTLTIDLPPGAWFLYLADAHNKTNPDLVHLYLYQEVENRTVALSDVLPVLTDEHVKFIGKLPVSAPIKLRAYFHHSQASDELVLECYYGKD